MQLPRQDRLCARRRNNASNQLCAEHDHALDPGHRPYEHHPPCQSRVKQPPRDAVKDPRIDEQREAEREADEEDFDGVEFFGGGDFLHCGDGGEDAEEEEEGADELAEAAEKVWGC